MFDLLFRPEPENWTDRLFFILIWILLLAIVSLLLWGVFIAVDSWFLPLQHGYGVITLFYYIPGHYQPQVITSGNTTLITQIWIPDYWGIEVVSNGLKDRVAISEGYYNQVQPGQKVAIDYVTGRCSGGLYIKSIY